MKDLAYLSLFISFCVSANSQASWQARIDDLGCLMLIEPRFSENDALDCGDFCSVISQFSFMYPNDKAPILASLDSQAMSLIHGVTIASNGMEYAVQILDVAVQISGGDETLYSPASDLYSGYLTGVLAEKARSQLLSSGKLQYKVNYSNGKSVSYAVSGKFFATANEMFETCKRSLRNHDV